MRDYDIEDLLGDLEQDHQEERFKTPTWQLGFAAMRATMAVTGFIKLVVFS